MELIYTNEKTKQQCTDLKAAQRLFGGDKKMALSLLSRVNALMQAETIKDIIIQPPFHFHKLENFKGNNLGGYFAIDVKTRRDPWRLILEPLNEDKQPYDNCNIDEIARYVRIVEIKEVSRHYE